MIGLFASVPMSHLVLLAASIAGVAVIPRSRFDVMSQGVEEPVDLLSLAAERYRALRFEQIRQSRALQSIAGSGCLCCWRMAHQQCTERPSRPNRPDRMAHRRRVP